MICMLFRGRGALGHPAFVCFLLAVLWMRGVPVVAAGDAAPLSLPDAVRVAVDRAASPLAADAAARAAQEMAVAAAQRPDPVLRASIDNLPVDGPDRFSATSDFMTMRSVSLMQTFTREGTRQARAERYGREADAALADRELRVSEIRRATATAWFECRAAEQRLAVLKSQRDEMKLQIDSAIAAQRGGRGTGADVLVARDALAQIDQASIAATAELANARRSLARWIGEAADRPLADAPQLGRHALEGRAEAQRLSRHPELAQLEARETVALAEAEVARAERDPDWSAELMFSQRGSRYSNMMSVGVSLPLPWDRAQRQDRVLAARLAQADALRAERAEVARERLAQIERWDHSWRSGLTRIALIANEREPLAQRRIEAALGAYRGGSVPLAAVLEARRAALTLQMELIDVTLETARTWAQLNFLLSDEGGLR